ncbi:MAG: hypothetical protein ACYDC8_08670 [Gammaproteobacteria bacterium]
MASNSPRVRYKLRYITNSRIAQWFGGKVSYGQVWICGISVFLNGAMLQVGDWSIVREKTFWDFILHVIEFVIFYLGFFGVLSVLSLYLLGYLFAIFVISLYVSSGDGSRRSVCIEAVLKERIINLFLIFSEGVLVYMKINGIFWGNKPITVF